MGLDDRVKNKGNQVGGKAKEAVGKVTDNEKLEAEGRLQYVEASLAEDTEKLKTGVKNAAKHVKDAFKK